MKRFLIRLLIFLVIAAGAAWLLYPTISNQLSAGRNDRVMEAYRKAVHALEPEAMQKMLDDAAAWNAELQKEGIPDVFSGGGRKTGAGYQELLNVSGGVIGELEIPGIHVKLPVYHGGSSAADRLIHVAGTDLPADRDGTHTVLAGPGIRKAGGILGDLQLTDARMLEDLEQATQNDLIFLRVLNRTMIFRVTDVKMLSPEGLAGVDLSGEEGEQLLTVMTERHGRRLLVQGKRIPAAEAKDKLAAMDRADTPADVINILALGIPVLLVGFVILYIIEKIKKRRYRLPTEMRKPRKREMPEELEDGDETEKTDHPEGDGGDEEKK